MKITLTWTNVEMKRNKSKATRKRDHKRHEQYIEQKKVTENNKETGIKETNTNNTEDSSSEDDSDSTDSEMDTIPNIITPCSTPSQVNRQNENQSINTTCYVSFLHLSMSMLFSFCRFVLVMSMKILYIVLQQCSLSIIMCWGDDPLYKQ
jgi:hypothetical protein